MDDRCQSCGMLFYGTENLGTEKKGKSQEYCNRCLKDGEFREQLTCEEMQSRVRAFLEKELFYPEEQVNEIVEKIPRLKRWVSK